MITIYDSIPDGVIDAMGMAGFGLYVLNYLLLSFRKGWPDGIAYFVTNCVAALLVLTSLSASFNLASVMIQIFWVGISVTAIIARIRKRRAPPLIYQRRRKKRRPEFSELTR